MTTLVALCMAAGTVAALASAWAMRRRPDHERVVVLTLFAVVVLGFGMGWLVLALTGG